MIDQVPGRRSPKVGALPQPLGIYAEIQSWATFPEDADVIFVRHPLSVADVAQIGKYQIEEDRPVSVPPQTTPHPTVSEPVVDCTMLDRIILRPSPDVQGTSMEGETGCWI
jgi:hypothetical protein